METAGYDSSRPLAEQVAQRIKDYILEEKLKSGDKLPTETALAREMGVARSTVREAIKRLESQNILTVRHGAGSFVTDQPGLADDPLGLDFIEDKERLAFDLLEVRNIIEPAIAALAARHATPEDIAEMESLYNLMEYHILHGQDYLDEDMKFHRTIARASGNLVAPQLAPIITASVEVFTEGTHRTLLQETLDTHKAVLEAIKCGDSTWARDAMTLHLSYNRPHWRYLVGRPGNLLRHSPVRLERRRLHRRWRAVRSSISGSYPPDGQCSGRGGRKWLYPELRQVQLGRASESFHLAGC